MLQLFHSYLSSIVEEVKERGRGKKDLNVEKVKVRTLHQLLLSLEESPPLKRL